MARFCTSCGAKLDEGARFCTKCGTAIPKDELQMESDQIAADVAAANASLDAVPAPGAASPYVASAGGTPVHATQSMPRVATQPGTPAYPAAATSSAPAFPQPQKQGGRLQAVLIGLGSGLAIVAVAAIVLLVFSPSKADERPVDEDVATLDVQGNEGVEDSDTDEDGRDEADSKKDDAADIDKDDLDDSDDALFNKNGYILPQADTHRYTEQELSTLTIDELFYARNEIYARHGRGFDSSRLRDYFSQQPWYRERYTPEEFDAQAANTLNDTEKANADLILKIEKANGSPNV